MFFVVEMPLNEEGNGPEMDPDKVFYTLYEVWNTDFEAVAAFNNTEDAEEYCDKLIQEWMGVI